MSDRQHRYSFTIRQFQDKLLYYLQNESMHRLRPCALLPYLSIFQYVPPAAGVPVTGGRPMLMSKTIYYSWRSICYLNKFNHL